MNILLNLYARFSFFLRRNVLNLKKLKKWNNPRYCRAYNHIIMKWSYSYPILEMPLLHFLPIISIQWLLLTKFNVLYNRCAFVPPAVQYVDLKKISFYTIQYAARLMLQCYLYITYLFVYNIILKPCYLVYAENFIDEVLKI